jgi:hypothetical protein
MPILLGTLRNTTVGSRRDAGVVESDESVSLHVGSPPP